MPRAKGSSRNPKPVAATAPLQGALRVEGENNDQSVLLKMLMNQMEAYESERRLEMAALQNMLKDTQDNFVQAQAAWEKEMERTKQGNADAIDAVRRQFQKIIEAKPVDQQTWQAMYKYSMAEAQKKIAANKADFEAALKTMPTTTVRNNDGKVVQLIINQIPFTFKEGINRKVPQVFAKEWQKRIDMRKWALGLKQALQSGAQGGDVSANDVARVTGRAPVWNEQVGRL